jgi:sulfur-carrier protein
LLKEESGERTIGLNFNFNADVPDVSADQFYCSKRKKSFSTYQGFPLPPHAPNILERPAMPNFSITIKLFAAYQEAYGTSELQLAIAPDSTVQQVYDRLLAEHPELEPWRSLTRFGVNLAFVEPETRLQPGDELVLIPPVSGG